MKERAVEEDEDSKEGKLKNKNKTKKTESSDESSRRKCDDTVAMTAGTEKQEEVSEGEDSSSFLKGKPDRNQEGERWKRCTVKAKKKEEDVEDQEEGVKSSSVDLIPETSSSLVRHLSCSSVVSLDGHQENHSSSREWPEGNQHESTAAQVTQTSSLFRNNHNHLLDRIGKRVMKQKWIKMRGAGINGIGRDVEGLNIIGNSTDQDHSKEVRNRRFSCCAGKKKKSCNQVNGTQKVATARAAIMDRARKRTLKMTIAIVLTFILCWTPYAVMVVWFQVHFSSAVSMTPSWLMSLLWVFAYTNSVFDPFVHSNHLFRISFTRFKNNRRRAHDILNGSLSNEITIESHL